MLKHACLHQCQLISASSPPRPEIDATLHLLQQQRQSEFFFQNKSLKMLLQLFDLQKYFP